TPRAPTRGRPYNQPSERTQAQASPPLISPFQQRLQHAEAFSPERPHALHGVRVGKLAVLDADLALPLTLGIEVHVHTGFIAPGDAHRLGGRRLADSEAGIR